MSLLDKLGKFADILVKPIEAVCEWAKEPLKGWEHGRQENSRENDRQHEASLLQTRIMSESDAKIRELEAQAAIPMKIAKAEAEISEWRKDKELERLKLVSDAVMRYTKELSELNNTAISAIGTMQIKLTGQAQALLSEKSQEYASLQKIALEDAFSDFARIENEFSGNEKIKNILIDAADKKLASAIDSCSMFIRDLNSDIRLINQSINSLAQSGQAFVVSHLNQFQVIAPPLASQQQYLSDKNEQLPDS